MKLFRIATLALLCAIVGLTGTLAGCKTVGAIKPPSPAQIAQTVCPVVQLDLAALQGGLAALTADPRAVTLAGKIAFIRPAVDAKCVAAETVTSADLQSFAQLAIPTMADVVAYLPLTPAQKTKYTNDLKLAQVALGVAGLVEQQIQAAQAAQSTSPKS